MGVMFKLDASGHGEVAKWGADAESRAAGTAAFQALADKGFTMFDITDPMEGKKLEAFDPNATEILAVPRMVGG